MGVASGWLECIGVVSGCCCKEVLLDILIIIITFPYSTCISWFFDSRIATSLFILKMFFHSFINDLLKVVGKAELVICCLLMIL